MVARALSEASGKICSRTSPRAEEDAEALGAFSDGADGADESVSVRTEAGVGAATGELCGCAAFFFSAAAFHAVCVAGGARGFAAAGLSRRAGCSTGFVSAGGCAAAVAQDHAESGRVPRDFGR